MGWMFVKDIAFYSLLGLILFVPIISLVAAFKNIKFKAARGDVDEFLREWAVVTESGQMEKIFNVAGISTVLVLLGFGAYCLNKIGDITMPKTSALVSHFNKDFVRWSIEHNYDEWQKIKFEYRQITGIRGDRAKWEEAKAQMGKYDLRFFRTIFFYFLFLLIAGTTDLVPRSKKKSEKEKVKSVNRGIALLLIAIIGLMLSQWLWADRQDRYVDNLISQYRSEYKFLNNNKEPELPPELTYILLVK